MRLPLHVTYCYMLLACTCCPRTSGNHGENPNDAARGRIPLMPPFGHPAYDPYAYQGQSANVSRVLDSLIKGYDKRLRPGYKGPPIEVGITMFVSSISSISEVDMDFTVDFYFRQHWRDERLIFSEEIEDELCISNEMLNQIWWPDTFFANAKDARFHVATTKNAFLRIKPNGDILHSLRLTVTAMCRMDLTFFPMDSQICSLEIESYGYSVKDIIYRWKNGMGHSVDIHEGVQLPQFKVRGHREIERHVELTTGNYSRMSCEFYFVRSLGYYIIQIYVPSILIVVLSWVSFWLTRDAVPARVALGITTVLTMTTLISSTNASLPKISYLKSIDVYLVTCFVMVFASLLEYAAVSYIGNSEMEEIRPNARSPGIDPEGRWKRSRMLHHHYRMSTATDSLLGNGAAFGKDSCGSTSEHGDAIQTEIRLRNLRQLQTECGEPRAPSSPGYNDGRMFDRDRVMDFRPEDDMSPSWGMRCIDSCCVRTSTIDRYSRIMFPAIFLVFNILYWFIYFNISQSAEESGFILL